MMILRRRGLLNLCANNYLHRRLSAMGLDPITSISGAMTAVANVGPGMVWPLAQQETLHHSPMRQNGYSVLGEMPMKLEILTILVVFFPAFWRT